MKIIDKNEKISSRTTVALGIFDGVHLGHQKVIEAAVKRADMLDALPAVFTFNTASVTSKGRLEALLSDTDKQIHFADLGVHFTYSAEFADLKELSAEQFVHDILKDKLGAVCVICGENFHFGKGGSADCLQLKNICSSCGIETVIIPHLKIGGEPVSSTRIRELIKSGGVARANALLGYRFGYTLTVEHGFARGRTWNFPTINQTIPHALVKPRFGVYCAKLDIDGRQYSGVCNVGVKPTVEDRSPPIAETYIFDFDGDLYGKNVELQFCEFVRPEMKFASVDELKAEIKRNTRFAKQYFGI